MGELWERLEALQVCATAPGGGVHAEMRGRNDVELCFSTGCYDRISESELERRLEGLARLLWTAYERARRAVSVELLVFAADEPECDNDRRFLEERDALVARGSSDDGRITISARGMRQWRVRLADDTVRKVGEREFCAGVRTAAARLIDDQLTQVMQLRGRIYR